MSGLTNYTVSTLFKGRDMLSAKLDKMIDKSDKLAKKKNKLKQLDEKLTSGARGVGTAMMAVAGAGIAAGGGLWKASEGGRQFDTAMSRVQANMGSKGTVESMKMLRDEANRLGETTAFSAAQAADGMDELAKAGYDANQIFGASGAVLSGAAAGGLELADAAAIMTSTIAGFNLIPDSIKDPAERLQVTLKQSQRVMDTFTATSINSKTSMATLAESMKSVAPVANKFNMSLEDSLQMVASMQNVGIEASEAGNSIKTMLTMLTAPSKEMARMMKKAKVSFIDSAGNMKMPAEIFSEAAKFQNSIKGNAKQVKAFADLVGMRGQKALLVLADAYNSDGGKQLNKSIHESLYLSNQIADIKLDNVEGDIVKLESAWGGVSVAINDAIKGPLREFVTKTTEGLSQNKEKFAELAATAIPFLIDGLQFLIDWGPAIAKIVLVIGSMILAVKAMSTAMILFNVISSMNPFVLGITLAIGAIMLFIAFFDDAVSGIKSFFSWLDPTAFGKDSGIGKGGSTYALDKQKHQRDQNWKNGSGKQDFMSSIGGDGGGSVNLNSQNSWQGQLGVTVDGPASVTSMNSGPGMSLVTQSSGAGI